MHVTSFAPGTPDSAQDARLVVSLATTPSRIGSLGPVIDSIKGQTRRPDGLYVCISEFCTWENRTYDVPAWLQEDSFVRVVVAPRDYGPAGKLLGVLAAEREPATRIVIVDDDWQYHLDMLERLERRFEPESRMAIGASGARLPRRWTRMDVRIGSEIETEPPLPWRLTFVAEAPVDMSVDLLQFGFGTIVLRDWFGDDIFDLVDPGQPWFLADDVLLSGYLASRGIARTCIAGTRLPRLLEQSQLSPLSGDGRMTARYRAAIPALASKLDIWRDADLERSFPRKPTLDDLRYWAGLALRGVGRTVSRRARRPPPARPR